MKYISIVLLFALGMMAQAQEMDTITFSELLTYEKSDTVFVKDMYIEMEIPSELEDQYTMDIQGCVFIKSTSMCWFSEECPEEPEIIKTFK